MSGQAKYIISCRCARDSNRPSFNIAKKKDSSEWIYLSTSKKKTYCWKKEFLPDRIMLFSTIEDAERAMRKILEKYKDKKKIDIDTLAIRKLVFHKVFP